MVDERNNADSSDSDPFAFWDKNQEAFDKLVEIKKQLSKHATPQEAHVITKAYLDLYAQTQDCSVLDNGLAFARRVARFADSLQQLSFQGTKQSVPRATSTIPFSPFDTCSNSINDLSSVGVEKYSDPLEWLRQQGISTSTTSLDLSSLLPPLSSQMRTPKQPCPTSKASPPASSCYRTPDPSGSESNRTTRQQASSTQKQKPDNRRKAVFIEKQKHYADPYYSYFGVPKEKFDADFFAWLTQNSLETLMT
jgi:hypothetical protein